MKLTKDQHSKMPADIQKLFTQVGETDVFDNGEEDATAIKGARDRERDAAKAAKEALATLQGQHDTLQEEHRKQTGKNATEQEKLDALDKSWKQKLADKEVELKGTITKRETSLKDLLVGKEARELAMKLAGADNAHLLERFIMDRLSAEYDGDKPSTRVLDANGQPSALTIGELEKELLADKRFSGILVGSSASGGGAGGGGGGGGAFDIKSYKNADGSVNWGKVGTDMATNPQLLEQVQGAMAAPGAQA